MTTAAFIPEVWSARYTRHVEQASVYSVMFNRNYEGEIRNEGDTVKILTLDDTTSVVDYTRNTDLPAPTLSSGTSQDLLIDQAKAFNFYVDRLDQVQAKGDLVDGNARFAANKIAVTQDTHLAGVISPASAPAGANIVNLDLTANSGEVEKVGDRVIRELLKTKTAMVKGNFPESIVPKIILPPDIVLEMQLYLAGLGGSTAQSTGFSYGSKTEQALAQGEIGNIAGFNIYMSNNVPKTNTGSGNSRKAVYRCAAGSEEACTLASQIVEVHSFMPERRFGTGVKGLYVWGAKRVNEAFLWTVNITYPDPA